MPDLDSLFDPAEVEAKMLRHQERARRAEQAGRMAVARQHRAMVDLCLSRWKRLTGGSTPNPTTARGSNAQSDRRGDTT